MHNEVGTCKEIFPKFLRRKTPSSFLVKDPRKLSTFTRLLNRKRFKVNKNIKLCSNHFQFGKPFDSHPHPTLFLKGYDRETKVTRKRKAPSEALAVQPTGRKKKRSDNYKQRVETETSHILETPEESKIVRVRLGKTLIEYWWQKL